MLFRSHRAMRHHSLNQGLPTDCNRGELTCEGGIAATDRSNTARSDRQRKARDSRRHRARWPRQSRHNRLRQTLQRRVACPLRARSTRRTLSKYRLLAARREAFYGNSKSGETQSDCDCQGAIGYLVSIPSIPESSRLLFRFSDLHSDRNLKRSIEPVWTCTIRLLMSCGQL